MKLEELKEGESARIVAIGGTGSLRKRILDLGMTKGCRITLVRKAPLGDPLEVELRGYRLTVRKSEASSVEIEKEAAE